MKEVLAFIRANRINRTKSALIEAGLPSFTGCKALGRGRRPVEFEIIKAINENPEDSADVLPSISQGGRLIPKRMISVVLPDDRVPEIVKILISVNQTGQPGDGKIFVLPVLDALRIRTGEEGEQAVDEMKA